MRKPSWEYRYTVRTEAGIAPAAQTDSLYRATTIAVARRVGSVEHGRGLHYVVYDHTEKRQVFTTRLKKGAR
jgi:hypothetical protein